MAFTIIAALPTPPQSTDTQAVFEARADAEIAALNPFIAQTNTLASEFNNFSKTLGLSFIGRSLTSQNIALGLLNFTVEQNLGYAVGNYLKIAAAIAPSNNMYGTVTAYSVTTGAMSINVELKTGTGTFSDWVFSLSSPANGAIGGTEFVVATGTASAYTMTPTNIISIYKEGLAWDVKFPVACIDSPVAAISGLANTNIVILASDGTYQNCAERDIIVGSISTLQLVDAGGGTLKLWLKDPAVEHTRLSVITADTPLTITNSLGKVIKSGGGASRIITLPVFSTFPLEGVIELISENASSLQLVRQSASDVIDFYGTNPATSAVTGAFLDVPYQTSIRIIRNNTSWQITNNSGVVPVVAFSAKQTTMQAFAVSTFTKIQFQTKEFDTSISFDNVTNFRFTPPIAGYYQVSGNFTISTTATALTLAVYKNGILAKIIQETPSTGTVAGSVLIFLNGSSDYIELYGKSGVAQNSSVVSGYTYFQAALIRKV